MKLKKLTKKTYLIDYVRVADFSQAQAIPELGIRK